MPRSERLRQAPAVLPQHAHHHLLRGMAHGIAQVLPHDLRFVIITFSQQHHDSIYYISNGGRSGIAAALDAVAKGFPS
ncbi:MAG: hypothetical protein WC722_17725 [Rhodospirillales bacterium]|jgi:hypothetical protein